MSSARVAACWLLMAALSATAQVTGPVPATVVVAWGDPAYDGCRVPADLTNAVGLACGSAHNLALLADGSIRAWGENGYAPPAGLRKVTAVSERFSFGLALLDDGTVKAWGANYNGALNVPSGLDNVVAVAAGDYHSLALKRDGTAIGWGGKDIVKPTTPLTEIVAISAGLFHSLALKQDGTVLAWGWNSTGQTSVPAGLSNVVAISAGGYHSLALKSDGTVVAWGGQPDCPQSPPAGLSGVAAISAGSWHNLALKSNGTVVAWGANNRGQCTVPAGLNNVASVSAGHMHSVALLSPHGPIVRTRSPDTTRCVGGSATLTVSALGAVPLTVQWSLNGTNLPGANTPTLRLTQLALSQGGTYTVTVQDCHQAAAQAWTTLTLLGMDAQAGLSVAGKQGAPYRIEASENLGAPAWSILAEIVMGSSPYRFVDETAPRPGRRFYRAVLLP